MCCDPASLNRVMLGWYFNMAQRNTWILKKTEQVSAEPILQCDVSIPILLQL